MGAGRVLHARVPSASTHLVHRKLTVDIAVFQRERRHGRQFNALYALRAAGQDGTAEGTEDVNLGPGLTEAEKFGRGLKQGWVAEVSTNSPDFEEVSLRLGPTAGDWQRWAKIRWDNGADGYTLVEEGDIAYDDTSTDAGTTTTGPGKHLATKTALANSPGWVAKVVRHAADWSTAVVWIGPPQSEWVSEVRLRWNSKLDTYELEGETMIPQEGGP